MSELNGLILVELRETRAEMTRGFAEQAQRLTRVETQIGPLLDNGQPGRISKIEIAALATKEEVQEMKTKQAKQMGWLAGVLVALEILWHLITTKIGINGHSIP